MKKSALKKALAMLLSATMMTSIMSVGCVSASSAEIEDTKNYYIPSEEIETTIDGTSNCLIELPETTQDGTSNCVIEPTEIPTVEIVTEPKEETEDTEPTEASKETYPAYPEPTNMADHTNPPTRQTEPSDLTTKIYFDVESSGWKNYSKIYCHIWRADGTGEWPAWQSKKELCTKESDGLYSYDTLNTGNEIKITDSKIYYVIFSADTGAQTYDMVMSGACLGDTAYVTGLSYEAPEDSEKKVEVAKWKNTRDCGSKKAITSTGFIIGYALLDGETNHTLVADYLIKYYDDQAKKDKVPDIMRLNGLSSEYVRMAVVNKLVRYVNEEGMALEDANAVLSEIDAVLGTQDQPSTINPLGTKIYFDADSAAWFNNKNVYCHFWCFDDTYELPNFETNRWTCRKEGDGIYSFDIKETGINPYFTDGKKYGLFFSNSNGVSTYPLVMDGSCLGDTAYLTGQSSENFENIGGSLKYIREIVWKNNADCGMLMQITSGGNIVGKTLPDCITEETFIAEYIVEYLNAVSFEDSLKRTKLYNNMTDLKADPMGIINEVKCLSEIAVAEGEMTAEDANALVTETEKFFSVYIVPDDTEPTGPIDEDIAPQDAKIYFDVETAGWKNYKNIYCHIWKADGTGEWPAWQSRKEFCTKEADGRYSYTLSKTGNEFRYSDKNLYCVIFSADTGAQTYEVVMNGACIGDTVYVTGNTFENPEDSEKKVVDAAWRNNSDCGARKRITLTGNVVGTSFVEGESDDTLMADYLRRYYTDPKKMRAVQDLFYTLKVDTIDVLLEVKAKEDEDVSAGRMTQADADAECFEIEKILKNVYVDYNLIYDINGDKLTDVNDVTTLQMYLANYDVKVKETKIDVDGDGIVDVKDVTALQLYLATPNIELDFPDVELAS